MKTILFLAFLLLSLGIGEAKSEDRFDRIKRDLKDAACAEFRFISVLESDIFETVDTTSGWAILASDKRYFVKLERDQYLFDLEKLFSYSEENNQVLVEKSVAESGSNAEFTFLSRLDELYKSYVITPDKRYRLIHRQSGGDNLPDSMVVTLSDDSLRLETLEYFDINEERNLIVILEQKLYLRCKESWFIPDFPDTVKWIEM
jgi:hypothetical protein